MLVKIKYVGSSENGSKVTVNQSYLVLGFTYVGGTVKAVIVDDNSAVYATVADVNDPAEWTLDSVTAVGCQSLV